MSEPPVVAPPRMIRPRPAAQHHAAVEGAQQGIVGHGLQGQDINEHGEKKTVATRLRKAKIRPMAR